MDLSHLNEIQKEAVITTDGPMMLLAGAGSGKTRTLVTKIQYLMDDKKVSPHKLLALTFSNKAAKEMRERIGADVSYHLGALQITTFHALCAKLLRNEATHLGLSKNFTIYDTSESKSIVKSILGKRGISLKEVSPNEVLYFIDGLKNTGHYPDQPVADLEDEIDKDDIFYQYYLEYESELHRSNAVDFGGLICGVLKLFSNFPKVLERYQRRFQYVLVDEYQDTNRAQFKLVTMIADHYKNICVVGDEDQSIYSWRGADIRNILDYETFYPNSKLIKLEQNYRSSKNIIDAATAVISKNMARKGKEMWTDNEQGDSISIVECLDDRSEADFIAKEVKRLIKDGVSPREIAIFYRTNAQSRVIEDHLRQNRVAYRVVAGIKFYERKEIKDIVAYLRLIVNPKDSLALSRIINIPVRGIGAITLRKIEQEAIKSDLSLWQMLEKLTEDFDEYKFLRLSAKVRSGISHFVTLLQEVMALNSNKEDPSFLYEKILSESGYYEALVAEKSYEAQARIENLDELLNGIKQYETEFEDPSLIGFLETITLDSSVDQTEGEKVEEVSMMTIHGAKGLEYHYVFASGAEENIFPSFQSIENGEDAIEEERRLFYVAMTRAMKRLYILFAQGRMLWGNIKFNGPSRFIDEIPENYYTWIGHGKILKDNKKKKNFSGIDYDEEFSQENSFVEHDKDYYVPKQVLKAHTYENGDSIKHKLYGIGSILSSDGFGTNEKVTIQFSDGTKKKFLLKFAPLERI